MDWVKEKMYKARLQRNGLQAREALEDAGNAPGEVRGTAPPRPAAATTGLHGVFWLTGGMVLGGACVALVWWAVSANQVTTAGTNSPGHGATGLHRVPAEPASGQPATGELDEGLLRLTTQVQALTASVAELRNELRTLHAPTGTTSAISRQPVTAPETTTPSETLPPPAATQGDVSATDQKDTGRAAHTAGSHLSAMQETAPVSAAEGPQQEPARTGAWVINLVSLSNQADAERFVAKAGSLGIATEPYAATVKGKRVWRVQVSGFASAADAKSKAGSIKERLGLKDIWVSRR